MYPWNKSINLNKDSDIPLYVQIANGIIAQVESGRVKPGTKLPGSRTMADLLNVHRTTVIAVYDELYAQAWLERKASSGTFITKLLPVVNSKQVQHPTGKVPSSTGFSLHTSNLPELISSSISNITYAFNDGFPDPRYAPFEALARAYTRAIKGGKRNRYFSYVNCQGVETLREVLADHLCQTRGISCTADNVFISRGSQMGLSLLIQILISPGDHVIIGQTNYFAVTKMLLRRGAHLYRIPVDADGICVDTIEEVCRQKRIRAVYVTPHHHHPTTVSLKDHRRTRLLSLAQQYGFAIIEDDYDYDFHYERSPLLPLSSLDTSGMVIYTGSLSKTINPAIRIGYVIAPANLMTELRKLRQITDHQGDPLLEQAVADLYKEGEIQRSLKKAIKAYKIRRDFFCNLLEEKLGNCLTFKIPEGGMAVWCEFNDTIDLPTLAIRCKKKGLHIPDGRLYDPEYPMNCARLGFSSLSLQELEAATLILESAIKKYSTSNCRTTG